MRSFILGSAAAALLALGAEQHNWLIVAAMALIWIGQLLWRGESK